MLRPSLRAYWVRTAPNCFSRALHTGAAARFVSSGATAHACGSLRFIRGSTRASCTRAVSLQHARSALLCQRRGRWRRRGEEERKQDLRARVTKCGGGRPGERGCRRRSRSRDCSPRRRRAGRAFPARASASSRSACRCGKRAQKGLPSACRALPPALPLARPGRAMLTRRPLFPPQGEWQPTTTMARVSAAQIRLSASH